MESASETGQLIAASTRKVMQAHCGAAQLKAAEGAWNDALWKELEAAGITTALEPEGKGERGIPAAEALIIVRIAGEFSAPVPLVENLLANWLLLSVGIPSGGGPMSIAPVSGYDQLALVRSGSQWHLKGVAHRVPWARHAAALVVVAKDGAQQYMALVPASSFSVTAQAENLAREARDQVTIDAMLNDDAVRPFAPGFEYLYAVGAAMRVLQMTGALDAVLRLTVQYAQDRKQFGRPIGKFQAIQQNIAVMAANIAAANAAANAVVNFVAENGSVHGIAAAKIRTNEAATIASKLAHQVHGAMGFTQDYELHFLTKRLWSWREEFGNEASWSRKLGGEVCRRGADQLWAFITSEMA